MNKIANEIIFLIFLMIIFLDMINKRILEHFGQQNYIFGTQSHVIDYWL